MRRLRVLLAMALMALPAQAGEVLMVGYGVVAGGSPPVFRSIGTISGGTGAISPGLPTGVAVGDLLVMLLETQGNEAITVSGWTACPGSPVTDASTLLTRLTCFYKIAVGSDATTTSDSGNHQTGQIMAVQAGTFNAATPFDVNQTSNNVAGTTWSITGMTTTVANTLILSMVVADAPDSTGAADFVLDGSMTSTERMNDTRANASGNGAAIALFSESKTDAGAYSAVFGTSNTTSTKANLMIAVK